MYNLLNKTTHIPAGKISWTKKYKFEEDEWGEIFSDPFKITKDSTVQWFPNRINHKILATNTLLYKMKLIDDPKCTFCYKRDETIEHLLWECECVKRFLNETISWLIQHGIHITLNEKSVIFGIDPDQKSDINKLVLMEIKYYIYYARCSKNNMNLTVLHHRLKLLYQTYKYSSISTGKYENFQTNWQNYHNLLDKTAD